MELNFFASMLNPDVKIIVYDGEDADGVVRAKNVDSSRYSGRMICDWVFSCTKPVLKVTLA